MVKVKICGITNLEDARQAVKAGCDAIGFVFYKKSQRYIAPEKAAAIRKAVPGRVAVVGVFVNAREMTVKKIARLCRLDMVQLHGDETPGFCRRIKMAKVIKAFRVKDSTDVRGIAAYDTFGYLIDSFSASGRGGTGRRFDWTIALPPVVRRKVLFLSGGLDSATVASAIRRFSPDWVDVSSSVERSPGHKDGEKMKKFVRAVKSARSS